MKTSGLTDCQSESELKNLSTSSTEDVLQVGEQFSEFHNCKENVSDRQTDEESHVHDMSNSISMEQTSEEQPRSDKLLSFQGHSEDLEDLLSSSPQSSDPSTDIDGQKFDEEPQNSSDCQPQSDLVNSDNNNSVDEFDETGSPTEVIVVSRAEWGAIPPRRVTPKPHLASVIVLTYYTFGKQCFTQKKCEKAVRKLQRFHMRQGEPDIPYNFMVGGDGRVYEGRGWSANSRLLIPIKSLNGHLIEVAFLGDYKVERPSEVMLDAALDLVQYGRENSYVNKRFGLYENYEGVEINPVFLDPSDREVDE